MTIVTSVVVVIIELAVVGRRIAVPGDKAGSGNRHGLRPRDRK